MDHVRNYVLQEDAKVCQMSTLLRRKRLNWYEHIMRSEEDNLSITNGGHGSTEKRRRGGLGKKEM